VVAKRNLPLKQMLDAFGEGQCRKPETVRLCVMIGRHYLLRMDNFTDYQEPVSHLLQA